MKKNIQVGKAIKQDSLQFFHTLFMFFRGAFQTASFPRILAACGAAVTISSSVLLYVFSEQPFVTNPVELLGSFAYYIDLNITNRLNAIFLFMIISMLTFIVIISFFYYLHDLENKLLEAVSYSLLPGLFGLASIILMPQTDVEVKFWFYLSAFLCCFALLAYFREQRNQKNLGSANAVLIAIVLSFFLPPATLSLIKSPIFWKILTYTGFQNPLTSILIWGDWIQKLQYLPVILVGLLWVFFPRRDVLLKFALYPLQLSILFFFGLILPGVFLVDGGYTQFFKTAPPLFFIALPLFVAGVWDCTVRCIYKKHSPISPFALLALLFFVYFPVSPIPGVPAPSNFYELGSRLPEFWMSFEGWSTLFKDVYITYGLYDYAQFLLAWLFTGQHTAAVYPYGVMLFSAFLLIVEFFAVASVLPAGLAFVICLVAGIGPQSVILIFLSILIHPYFVEKSARWIIVWIVISAFAPFARIPQGAIFVVASLPAFLWQAIRLFNQDRIAFKKVLLFLGGAAIVMVIWPFGKYFWGLLRIFSETSHVNSPWAANLWKIDTVPLLEVFLGNAVLVIPLVSLVAMFILLRFGKRNSRFFIAYFVFFFVVIYSFISISYGFSRTDEVPYFRQLQVFITVLLPLLVSVMVYVPSRVVKFGCFFFLFVLVSLNPLELRSPGEVLQTASDFPALNGATIQNAAEYGLPNLGLGQFPEGYLEEEKKLKKAFDQVLEVDETFLDLTMVGMHYFNSERKLITEYPVYYVYPGDKSQLRAVEKLSKHDVNITLLEPNYLDKSPSSVRTYYLYRYALMQGTPWKITPRKTLLMPEELFIKVGETPPSHSQSLLLLDEQFSMVNFFKLPGVWGRGFQEFKSEMTFKQKLSVHKNEIIAGKLFLDIPLNPPLKGTEAGLLVLDLVSPAYVDQDLVIRWIDETYPDEVNQIQFRAMPGVNIVPLDSSPRWLLADSISSLQIEVPLSTQIAPQKIQDSWNTLPMSLYQRPYIDENNEIEGSMP